MALQFLNIMCRIYNNHQLLFDEKRLLLLKKQAFQTILESNTINFTSNYLILIHEILPAVFISWFAF